MNLGIDEIRKGGIYIKKGDEIARQVTAIEHWVVEFKSIGLSNGEYYLASHCSLDHLTHWAEREATPTEYAKLDSEKVEMHNQEMSLCRVYSPLKDALKRSDRRN